MAQPCKSRLPGRRRRGEQGIAAIEMALLLPLLLLILCGMLEYGWMFMKVQQLGAAARLGARLGVTQPATTSAVNAAIDAYMASAGLGGSGYSVTISPSDVASMASGGLLTVTVNVSYDNVGLTGFPLPKPETLSASTTMSKEGPP